MGSFQMAGGLCFGWVTCSYNFYWFFFTPFILLWNEDVTLNIGLSYPYLCKPKEVQRVWEMVEKYLHSMKWASVLWNKIWCFPIKYAFWLTFFRILHFSRFFIKIAKWLKLLHFFSFSFCSLSFKTHFIITLWLLWLPTLDFRKWALWKECDER